MAEINIEKMAQNVAEKVIAIVREEYISKADYETRLKADMVDILADLQLEIEETDSGCGWDGYIKKDVINDYLQSKINSLKED